jgi:hypothetical protein
MSGNAFAYGRFAIAALLVFGGIAAIYWGYRLFLHGAGLSRAIDQLDFKSDWGKVSFAGMTVGSALMVTSVFWGGFAYMSVPKLELAGDLTKITQVPVTNTGPADVASAVGATIIDKDKATIGTIKDVVLTSPTQAAGYVVDLAGSKPSGKPVFLGANAVTFGKGGTASVHLSTDQFLQLNPVTKSDDKRQWQLEK